MKSLPDSAIKEDTYTAAETIIDEYKSKRDNILKSIKNTVRTSYKHLPRWQNEFRFFYYIKLLHPDAIYQYTSEWLGNQSFDVFIPEFNLAVEYQGKQHYMAVPFFGGDEKYKENINRDAKKRRLAEERNITVLEWIFRREVNLQSVANFLDRYTNLFPDKRVLTNRWFWDANLKLKTNSPLEMLSLLEKMSINEKQKKK